MGLIGNVRCVQRKCPSAEPAGWIRRWAERGLIEQAGCSLNRLSLNTRFGPNLAEGGQRRGKSRLRTVFLPPVIE
jgi:hypothetical protein